MYTTVTTITPQEAVEILDTKNFGNRPISAFTVYAWNAYLAERRMRGFSYKPAEALPEISGISTELARSLLD